MGDLFWNKVIGAGLGTLLAVFALKEGAHMLVHPHELEEPAYPIAVAEDAGGSDEAEVMETDVGAMLAAADPARGGTFARTLCGSCHTFDQGEPTLTGPNLWNLVDRPVASMDFTYTPAMHDFGGEWTYERLWTYLEAPQRVVPGTAMTFAGLANEGQRANVIAFLGTLSDNPAPFPAPHMTEEAAPEGAATDEEAAPGEAAPGEAASGETAPDDDAEAAEDDDDEADADETP